MRGIFAPMMKAGWLMVLVFVLAACNNEKDADACKTFFRPYPDLFANTERSPRNAALLDAMAKYRTGDYANAEHMLKAYLGQPDHKDIALIYLASAQLAQGRPFDAELQLDHLEKSNLKDIREETEWYTLLCWVCSEQHDRAVEEARRMAGLARHTHQRDAQELLNKLEQ